MNTKKIILSGLALSVAITTTGCGLIDSSKPAKAPKHIVSSSLKDDTFIPKNLTELNSEELLKTITDFGERVSATEENAKVGKLIKSYFEKIGLQPYKDNSYYHSFYAKQYVSFTDLNTNEDKNINLDGKLENVIGKINGEDSSKAIIVSAHFDAFFGTKGVLDNASGTTTLLEVAKNLAKQLEGKTFPVDIVFVGFNGEEEFLLGSEALYKELSKDYKDFYNINIDCVGLKDKPLAYKNSHAKSQKLYDAFEAYIDKYKISKGNTDYMTQGSSDNAPFQNNKKAAIVLGEDIPSGLIHTKKDNHLDLIDFQEIDNLVKAISDFIIESNGKIY